ncbi:hypothetical protein AC579_5276 [Pseudocercospora musae]|uniref:Uncharacterized protein n=1 Tax=Pseudocercospora musae TaxID=113226 RepID=A0A139IPP4_9PEZI|nr:hypothetical protein AC579_5276 [Pseudocercospora musae]
MAPPPPSTSTISVTPCNRIINRDFQEQLQPSSCTEHVEKKGEPVMASTGYHCVMYWENGCPSIVSHPNKLLRDISVFVPEQGPGVSYSTMANLFYNGIDGGGAGFWYQKDMRSKRSQMRQQPASSGFHLQDELPDTSISSISFDLAVNGVCSA